MEKINQELVVVPLEQLKQVIQSSVEQTIKNWFEEKTEQERNDRINEEETLTMKQICDKFHIGRTSVYSRIEEGILNPIKIGNRLRFIKKDVLDAMKGGKMEKYCRIKDKKS